jgi:hypothetical protein
MSLSFKPFGDFEYRCEDFRTSPVVCHICCALASKRCDYEKDSKRCDASLCNNHAVRVGLNKDHCASPTHGEPHGQA